MLARTIAEMFFVAVLPSVLMGAVGGVIYGLYRAYKKWGAMPIWFFAAAISLLDAGGVFFQHYYPPSRRLWGPINTDLSNAWTQLTFACTYLILGLCFRNPTQRRPA